ncbi:MAG TPA: hypothetical protein VN668_09240 [Stellaceae bacterium]|nr:hypothetical protein [Stellaceae bacterium]
MSRIFAALAVSGLAFGLAGCASEPSYTPPTLPPDRIATITGSEIDQPGPFSRDYSLFVFRIDGVRLASTSATRPVTLAPGHHVLQFALTTHNLFKPGTGVAAIAFDAAPGTAYVLRSTMPRKVSYNCTEAAVWIETSAGKPASDSVNIGVVTYSGGEAPLPGGGFIMIPPMGGCRRALATAGPEAAAR